MPPVMGAAAFLMVEYVGIPYSEIVQARGAAGDRSPTSRCSTSSHLEAVKIGIEAAPARKLAPTRTRLIRTRARRSRARSSCSCAHLLRHRGRASASSATRRRWVLGSRRSSRSISWTVWYAARYPDLDARRSERADHSRCRDAWDVTRTGLAFPHPARGAALVPDGRADVAGPVGILGDGRHARHRC